jgi:very-short-patch-repair endonuclease
MHDPTSLNRRWSELAVIAARNDGLVDECQLRSVGVVGPGDRRVLARLVREGRLVKAAPQVWQVEGAPPTWCQRLRIGLIALGERACVSHDAAAQLHRFDRTPSDRVEFTVPRPAKRPPAGSAVHSTRYLPPIDVVRVDGLRTTSATRTVIDLARARVSEERLAAAIDSAVRTGSSSPATLQRRLAALRGPGRWGCRRIDELLAGSGGHTMLERLFLELMREARLPRPDPQVVFRDDSGTTIARVDFLYPAWSIVVEVTGRLGHSTPSERAKDAQRRNELQDIGLRVHEYTWEDVTRRPEYVKESMTARLRRAGWQPD